MALPRLPAKLAAEVRILPADRIHSVPSLRIRLRCRVRQTPITALPKAPAAVVWPRRQEQTRIMAWAVSSVILRPAQISDTVKQKRALANRNDLPLLEQKNTSDSRQEETSGGAGKDKPSSEDHKKTDPRVAQETAADSAAADLIAKVDLELDQAQSKDLETRRRVFKNLMLKWHPDKNQEEAMATEVFRHVMARRGAFLEA